MGDEVPNYRGWVPIYKGSESNYGCRKPNYRGRVLNYGR